MQGPGLGSCVATVVSLCGLAVTGSAQDEPTALKKLVVATYAEIASAVYADSVRSAETMEQAIEAFLRSPSPQSLQIARDAWRKARIPYVQSEAYRFCGGPIDAVEPQINAWPVDERYIDYVVDEPSSGIVNAVEGAPQLTPALLTELNEKEGEKNISVGYHAIEFLLWGQDLRADGPGDRSHQDYLATTRNAARRAQYLRITTRLLVGNLRTVASAWSPGQAGNYRASLTTLEPDAALRKLIKGLGSLSGAELAGERLTVPHATKEQEDEHSCFSDTTHDDVVLDALGIQNVYLGRYVRTDGSLLEGPGLHALVERLDPRLAAKLAAQIDRSVTAARAIPAPFDQAILGRDASPGRVAIKALIRSLEAQTALLTQAASAAGLTIDR